jgi:hypothetical protein
MIRLIRMADDCRSAWHAPNLAARPVSDNAAGQSAAWAHAMRPYGKPIPARPTRTPGEGAGA